MQSDAALDFDADQYSFFGALGSESKLDGALEVCYCNALDFLKATRVLGSAALLHEISTDNRDWPLLL